MKSREIKDIKIQFRAPKSMKARLERAALFTQDDEARILRKAVTEKLDALAVKFPGIDQVEEELEPEKVKPRRHEVSPKADKKTTNANAEA